jgi:hypothetical protein
MDQVKKIGRVLMAQRFWIICAVITIMPVGSWFSETSSMNKTATERKTLIEGKFKDAQAVSSEPNHPNEAAFAGMDAFIEGLKQEVGGAWRFQYEQQKNLLVWPEELGPEFMAAVKPMNPIERVKFPTPTAEELAPRLRERYRDYIKEDLPKLAQIIDANWLIQVETAQDPSLASMPGGFGGATMPGAGMTGATDANGNPIDDTSKVLWNSSDQQALFARYDWSTRPDKVPRTIDVLYAQEDLWVMNALMRIVAAANEGATGRYNAVVKEISYITLGRSSVGKLGMVTRVGANATGYDSMGMGGMGMGEMMGGSMGMESSMAATGSEGGAAAAMPGAEGGMEGMGMGMGGMAGGFNTDPAEGRYVDSAYAPVPATNLRSAIESDAQDEAQAYLLVAKRMPIRLGLTIDQRKLNRFITACGNSKLMVEVRQVRFNRQSGPGSPMGGGGGMGGMGSMMGGMGGMSGMSSMSGMMGRGGEADSGMGAFGGGSFGGMSGSMPGGYSSGQPIDNAAEIAGNDKQVEIFGVIYIYNPVDVRKLKLEEKASTPAPETTPAPSTPADTTTPATSATPADATAAPATPTAPPATTVAPTDTTGAAPGVPSSVTGATATPTTTGTTPMPPPGP